MLSLAHQYHNNNDILALPIILMKSITTAMSKVLAENCSSPQLIHRTTITCGFARYKSTASKLQPLYVQSPQYSAIYQSPCLLILLCTLFGFPYFRHKIRLRKSVISALSVLKIVISTNRRKLGLYKQYCMSMHEAKS